MEITQVAKRFRWKGLQTISTNLEVMRLSSPISKGCLQCICNRLYINPFSNKSQRKNISSQTQRVMINIVHKLKETKNYYQISHKKLYFVHNWSQAWEKEEGCGRLMARVNLVTLLWMNPIQILVVILIFCQSFNYSLSLLHLLIVLLHLFLCL